MKGLKVVLWICGILLLLEFVWMLVPARFVASWCERLGVELPFDAMSLYMMRMCQASFGLVGVFLVILAKDPLKYGPMVLLAGYGDLFLALAVLVWGSRYRLPPLMVWLGTVALVIVGVLILVFRGKAIQEQGAPQQQQGEAL
jgi:hypothetical protein